MKKIVMFLGGIETQEYFSIQLAKELRSLGHEVFFYPLDAEDAAAEMWKTAPSCGQGRGLPENLPLQGLRRLLSSGQAAVLTFNFHGLNGEKGIYQTWEPVGKPRSLWDEFQVPCYNIVLDHPLYYHDFYSRMPERYVQFSIDRNHQRYMEEYYPSISLGGFLPLAGTKLTGGILPLKKRQDVVAFTGNYTPPEHFKPYITRLDEEYTAFYYSIIRELIEYPERTLEDVGKEALLREMGPLRREDLRVCFQHMNFLDLYVRNYYRGEAVRSLAESGVPVCVYGSGWELLEAKKDVGKLKKNLSFGGLLNSVGCLKKLGQAKLSLNVMPWFRDGAHDRIFNSMANGAVCLTDPSGYLEEILTDGEDILFYDRKDPKYLPALAQKLLSDPAAWERIQKAGYEKAVNMHTWVVRARELSAKIEAGCGINPSFSG